MFMNGNKSLLQAAIPSALVLLLIVVYLFTYNSLILCEYADCNAFVALKSHLDSLLEKYGSENIERQIQSFSGRLTWTVIIGINIIASIVALFAGLFVAFRSIHIKNKGYRAGIIGLVITVITVIPLLFLSSNEGNEGHPWRQFLHEPLRGDFELISRLNPYMDMVGLAVALLIAIATSLFLFNSLGQNRKDDHQGKFHLNMLLYTGALLLVVNTLRVNAFLDWSLSYLNPNEAIFGSLIDIASAIVLSQGIFYTLMLAAVFLPAFYILSINGLSPTTGFEDKVKSFVSEGIPKALAILGPFLTGPIAQLL